MRPLDARMADAISPDAGPPLADSGALDARFLDSGPLDGGSSDAGCTETIVFGPDGVEDSELRGDCHSPEDQRANFGSVETLSTSGIREGGCLRLVHSVLRFDTSAIPAGVTIVSATLRLYLLEECSSATAGSACGTYPGSWGVPIQALLRPWREDQVSWFEASAGAPWEEPGATGDSERDPETFGPRLVSGEVTGRTIDVDVRAVVRRWAAGTLANNGLLFRSARTSGTRHARFASSEAAVVEQRPTLEVTYAVDCMP